MKRTTRTWAVFSLAILSFFMLGPGDGCISPPDSDADGVNDAVDNCPFTPNFDQANTDGDWMGDACDGCPYDPTKTEPGPDGCNNQGPPLAYADFMKGPRDEIASNLAEVLNVGPVSFSEMTSTGVLPVGLAMDPWTSEGYDYAAANGAHITIWVDMNDQPYIATYLLSRMAKSEDWSYGEDAAASRVTSIVEQLEIPLDGSEQLTSQSVTGSFGQGRHPHMFRIQLSQVFSGSPLTYPAIWSEVEGSTGEICFLSICRWYLNLNAVSNVLSDDELAQAAIAYFEASAGVSAVPDLDNVTMAGFYIVHDRLCQRIGSAIIDEWGSFLDVYVDVETGDILDELEIWVG